MRGELRAKVIGNFQPSVLSREVIAQEFTEFCAARGYPLCRGTSPYWAGIIEVRTPSYNRVYGARDRATPFEWHQDGFGPCGGRNDPRGRDADGMLVVWSNEHPTEVVAAAGSGRLTANHGDVIVADNLRVLHRTPEGARGNSARWFARGHSHVKWNATPWYQRWLAGWREQAQRWQRLTMHKSHLGKSGG